MDFVTFSKSSENVFSYRILGANFWIFSTLSKFVNVESCKTKFENTIGHISVRNGIHNTARWILEDERGLNFDFVYLMQSS